MVFRMPRKPSQIGFVCESCKKAAKARQIRRWLGQCRRCQAQSWTLLVSYTDTEVDTSALGLLTSPLFGHKKNTYTNQTAVNGLSARIAQYLTETKSLVASRVVDVLHRLELQSLHDRGAQSCRICDALYVPAEQKPWTQQGYCSKSCAAHSGPTETPIFEESTDDTPTHRVASTVKVICTNGHEFQVLASFSGCIRVCPDCAAKTPIP